MISSVGGNVDREKVYNQLLNQDEQILSTAKSEQDLKQGELTYETGLINKDTAQFNLTRAQTQERERLRNMGIEGASYTWVTDMLRTAPMASERYAQEQAGIEADRLGYKGKERENFIQKAITTTLTLKAPKSDETQAQQFLVNTINSTYDAGVKLAEDTLKSELDRIPPADPVLGALAGVTSESEAIANVVSQYPSGYQNFLITDTGQGAALRDEINNIITRARDNYGSVPPQVIAAALKEGIVIDPDMGFRGGDEADYSGLYKAIQKYMGLYDEKVSFDGQRAKLRSNHSKVMADLTKERDDGMLYVMNNQNDVANLRSFLTGNTESVNPVQSTPEVVGGIQGDDGSLQFLRDAANTNTITPEVEQYVKDSVEFADLTYDNAPQFADSILQTGEFDSQGDVVQQEVTELLRRVLTDSEPAVELDLDAVRQAESQAAKNVQDTYLDSERERLATLEAIRKIREQMASR